MLCDVVGADLVARHALAGLVVLHDDGGARDALQRKAQELLVLRRKRTVVDEGIRQAGMAKEAEG